MNLKEHELQPLQKKRIKYYPYYQKSDCQLKNKTPPDGQRYLIQFNSKADINKSLIDIFLIFFSTINQTGKLIHQNNLYVENSKDVNAVFKYMIELYHLQDKFILSNIKTSESQNMYLREILGKYQNDTILKNVIDQCKKEVDQQVSIYRKGEDFIKSVRIIQSQLVKKCQKYILSLPLPVEGEQNPNKRRIYIPQEFQQKNQIYINRLLNKITQIQFTKKKYNLLKLQHFKKAYQKILQPMQIKGNLIYSNKLVLKRYTLIRNVKNYHNEQVLINLNDLFHMKKQDVQCTKQYTQIMRQLGQELQRHNSQTKQFYPLLHPKNIIFNQISLRVHLSYQKPLLSALGLLKMPMSTQQMISFAVTPQVVDLFSAPNENLQVESQQFGTPYQIFYDLHYGMDSLIQQYDHKYKNDSLVRIIDGKSMSQIKLKHEQISQAWRFIMIFSYLINRQHYCKKMMVNPYNLTTFKQFLKEQFTKSQKDVTSYTKNVLGKNFPHEKVQLNQSKQLNLSIFDNFVSGKQIDAYSQDSPHRFYKINRFLSQKKYLKKDIEQILIKQKTNCKMNNPTRHLILFYLDIFQSMFHINLLCNYYVVSYKKGQQIFNQIKDKLNITKFGQGSNKKTWIQVSFNKFKEYEANNSKGSKNQSFRYVLTKYYEAYQQIVQYKDTQLRLKYQMKNVMQIDGQQAKIKLSQIIKQVRPAINKCQFYISNILNQQLKLQSKEKLFQYSLHIKIRLFLILTQDNFIDLDSLIFPMLNLKKQSKEQRQDQKQQILEQCAAKYQYALMIIQQYEAKMHNLDQAVSVSQRGH